MGGQNGLRGYVYQGIVAIIKALGEKGWNKISVEYNSPMDKVDIALLDNDVLISAIQVKSSINLFGKKEVIEWMNSLISDVSAGQYEIVLLGTPDANANIFINSIEQYYKGEKTQKMKDSLNGYEDIINKHKIKINTMPYNVDLLLAHVRDSLNRYIESKGYSVQYSVLEKLSNMILGADMLLATSGEIISKQEYEDRIIEWLDLSCGKGLISGNLFSSINILFYSCGNFTNSIKPLKITELQNYLNEKSANDYKIQAYISKISEINVYEEDSVIEVNGMKLFHVNDPFPQILSDPIPYVIIEKMKNGIIDGVKNLLGKKLDKDFFDLGDLKQKQGLNGDIILVGTQKQVQKEKLLWDFYKLILNIYGFECYISSFKDIIILPIALKNQGRIVDNNISITFSIPKKNVVLLDLDNIVNNLCFNINIASQINNEKITERIWTPVEDNNVEWEGNSFYVSKIDNYRYINKQSLILEKEKILEDLQQKINYDVIFDASNKVIIKTKIKSLRPDEAKMLEKYMVFNNIMKSTVIDYSIISEGLSSRIEGKLYIE